MSGAPWFACDGMTIYNARCEDVLPDMADDSVDIVVTSPPYNMGLVPGGNGRGLYRPGANNKGGRFRDGYDGTNDDALPQDVYDEWQRWCLGQMWRIARLAVFYNHRPRVQHGVLRDPLGGFYGDIPLRQRIVWDRGTGTDVNLRGFCTRGEYVLLFAKPAFQLVDHSASGMGDVWRLGVETKVAHPAPFPVALPARCIAATGAQSVLDPFMGSGSTLRAAADAGIEGIGIEKSAPFCEIARDRLAQGSLFATAGSGIEDTP